MRFLEGVYMGLGSLGRVGWPWEESMVRLRTRRRWCCWRVCGMAGREEVGCCCGMEGGGCEGVGVAWMVVEGRGCGAMLLAFG